jgi:hypothetical protein
MPMPFSRHQSQRAMPVGPGQALKTAALRDCEPSYDRSGVILSPSRPKHAPVLSRLFILIREQSSGK